MTEEKISNNDIEDKENIEFCKKLETVALGCHQEVHSKIKKVFKDHEIESYQCVEFVLKEPQDCDKSDINNLNKKSFHSNVKVFFPFLFRLINLLPFITEINNEYKLSFAAKAKDSLRGLRKIIRIPSDICSIESGISIFHHWKNKPKEMIQPLEIKNSEELKKIKKGETENSSARVSVNYLISPWLFNKNICENKPLIILEIPIATMKTFYGYFLVAYQILKEKEDKKEDEMKKNVTKDIYEELKNIIHKIYVPTLILFHVSNWEDKLDNLNNLDNIKTKLNSQFPLKHWVYSSDFSEDEFKPPLTIEGLCKKINDDGYNVSIQVTINTIDWLNEFLKTPNFYDILCDKKPNNVFPKNITDLVDKTKNYRKNKKFSALTNYEQNMIKRLNRLLLEKTYQQNIPEKKPNSKQDEFEAAFGKVWERRMGILNNTEVRNDETRIQNFKNTLYFHEYNIASPGMIKLIRDLISGAKLMKRPESDGRSLPTALVFGEAGSGKDTMARLISLFTEDYSSAKTFTINMAALKPNALAIPLLFGIKPENMKQINIDGMISNDKVKDNSVIIFDELNSLDHDLQGSLLRILENGEVWPLFSSEPKLGVKNLIIGIVNEDPEIVSREKEFKELKAAEAFLGKVIGSFLYKNFYSVKKLRPDLMYRLKRGLYLRIPPLNERREDIPILFAANMRKALKSLHGGENLAFEIEMDALERLMKEDIDWPGNIRQLEAVTKDIAYEAYEEQKKNNSTDEIEIDFFTVEKVLKKILN